MKLTTTKYRPQLKHFALSFGVTMLVYTLLCGVIYLALLVVSGMRLQEFWQDLASSSTVWLFPLLGSLTYAFSFQQHKLTITGIEDPGKVADWAANFLQEEGRTIISTDYNETVLASPNKFYRLFNYWLGAELVGIRYSADYVTVTGHYRHIDLIDSKIRFGKPAFDPTPKLANS
ncbi:hypothetical protein K3G39_08685 [Pontibacter sp. HSC-14F20]|uniref:hypothetical protein n=1 Tax=Pontibacter sp. HSC-14F20 TaxID=2864136 RepID=UPI001C734B4C|nr:hypothetical protein [Pontibacter sp. HSC-14F20]MBX0333314.1 hypothetical protein [Pontibacter sp. HSC-14F20]